MKTFKVVMPVLVYLIISVPAFAQDFGTLIHFSSENSLWNTDWSLDGKWITFGYGEDIWIVSTVDGTKKNLTLEIEDDCSFPVFSPDGSEVMFSCRFIHESKQASSTLRSINIETGNISIVMEEAYSGSYSRDGNYLVYIYWPDPDNHVNMCHAVHNLENNKTEYYDFFGNAPPYFNFGNSQMSPDNTYFVTTLGKIGGQDNSENPDALYRVYLDGSVEEILSDGAPWYPKFSPDGKWILYTRWDYSDMDVVRNKPARAIYVYNMETGETINPIPNNSYWSLCGSWSPDGKKICYIIDNNGEYSLYIKDFEYASESEDIQVRVEEKIPDGFALTGNYPNPFNPSTTIEFSMPEAGFTDLFIYNMTGQKVRELVSQSMSAGVHSVVWDGHDDSGLPVSAGMYITQLRMGDTVTSGRMMLVK